MKKYLLYVLFFLFSISSLAESSVCKSGDVLTSNNYHSLQWYRTSAEKNAIYREIFLLGEEQIKAKRSALKLQLHQWGVVFDIDETLLDNTAYDYQSSLHCKDKQHQENYAFFSTATSIGTPGAKKITCDVKKMGGYVSLVTNRQGNDELIRQATVRNLKKEGICFDQILFANNIYYDKNGRFNAVISGNYPADIIVYNRLPAHQVIAYFGDNIQDFPKIHQNIISTQNPHSIDYDNFGASYFVLPNPLSGSWEQNKLSS